MKHLNVYYFNPSPDFNPPPYQTGYPGGTLAVSSSNHYGGVVWAVIPASKDAGQSSQYYSNEYNRTQGSLWAYQAVPVTNASRPTLSKIWDTADNCSGCQTFCASPYAVPTVVQAWSSCRPTRSTQAGIPSTSALRTPVPLTTFESGVLVYGLPR